MKKANKLLNKQNGLSLIEASMVLVLSAVVVAGVMIYYQSAQSNNQLAKTSAQIMHINSEINGLYAGAKRQGNKIYDGFTTQIIANSISDLTPLYVKKEKIIKTPIPDVGFYISTGTYDAANKKFILPSTLPGAMYPNYLLGLVG